MSLAKQCSDVRIQMGNNIHEGGQYIGADVTDTATAVNPY